jgi:hypothetical protein
MLHRQLGPAAPDGGSNTGSDDVFAASLSTETSFATIYYPV